MIIPLDLDDKESADRIRVALGQFFSMRIKLQVLPDYAGRTVAENFERAQQVKA